MLPKQSARRSNPKYSNIEPGPCERLRATPSSLNQPAVKAVSEGKYEAVFFNCTPVDKAMIRQETKDHCLSMSAPFPSMIWSTRLTFASFGASKKPCEEDCKKACRKDCKLLLTKKNLLFCGEYQ